MGGTKDIFFCVPKCFSFFSRGSKKKFGIGVELFFLGGGGGKFCLNSRISLVLVILSPLVERCLVSRMRDFLYYYHFLILIFNFTTHYLNLKFAAKLGKYIPGWQGSCRKVP